MIKLRPLFLPFVFLPLAFLWFALFNHLRVEWTLNPQYGYGWVVPFLCANLIWRKVEGENWKSEIGNWMSQDKFQHFRISAFSFLLLALFYAPTRLIEEANPDWRLVSWALAVEVVGLTLLEIYFVLGAQWLKRLAFPVCFFLVAVPWPTLVEGPVIQGLTRADAGATCELLNWLGIPAMPHGNVIEVATGEVGIDEACSGIRSFQATLMISLFLGERYRLPVLRRFILCFAGFGMSFGFNLVRMAILVWVAASQGVDAIAKWHDPTGVTILVACFCGLWGLGVLFGKKQKAVSGNENAEKLKIETLKGNGTTAKNFSISAIQISAFSTALIIWILAVEISVEWWYRSHETRLPLAPQWTVAWPSDNPTFKELPLPDRTRQILRYDEGLSAAWQENGIVWQAIFLRWNPGRTAVHLAQNHTPEVCLTAAGHTLAMISEMDWFDVRGLRLPFIAYKVTDTPRPFYVFYCLWDDRASAQGLGTMLLTYGNRLAPVLVGLRNPGQRSLEIAVGGVAGFSAAETAVREELEKIVSSTPPSQKLRR
jgi:exosortase